VQIDVRQIREQAADRVRHDRLIIHQQDHG